MAKKQKLTDDEVVELFSELDESGVIDPSLAAEKRGEHPRRRGRHVVVDPLSEQDPSGSKVGKTISRTAGLVIAAALLLIVGMQVVYGVNRRLNTANLSDRTNIESVTHAMESGVEWGNGFTQFPERFTVDEANEKTGTVEVSVVDTDSKNELELLSNSQIQASALATNALLNDKINRMVYNVYTLVDDDGNFQHDSFFGFVPARGMRRAMLTFIWTKSQPSATSSIDWELKIIGMDDETAEAIQKQVNSVSSITEKPGVTQGELDDDRSEALMDVQLSGAEVQRGGAAEKTPEDVVGK